ncbi:beta-glucosidase family protein [Yinghuangia sp. YIM S09857]|uniref:beta-glucosidase n=1 Tax=Yinghuangia sp. YIM S09857 TaxID=3436929 RepID=UPI003F53A2B8
MTESPHTAPQPAASSDAILRDLVARLSLDDKLRLVTGEDVWSLPELPQIGLRKLRMSDGPVGVRGTSFDAADTSVVVPNPSAQAAAWDPAVAREVGTLLGAQARAKDVHILLAPTVNMHRTPLGGRHFECFSEDPLLTARTATAYVEGVQAQGVAATVKHFVANDAENERMTYDVRADERTLREVYLAPFEAAVRDAGAWLVMSAYNGVNGATMTANSPLQNEILKQEWGFDGVVVSDWMAVRSSEPAFLGGTDVAMPGPVELWGEPIRAAIAEGRVDEAVLDDKVLRILRLAARVGALGDAAAPAADPGILAGARERIRTLTTRTMVLLENRGGTLPFDTSALRRVALIGPNAVRMSAQGGGSATCFPEQVVDIAEGLRSALGPDVELTVRDGAFTHRKLPGISRANSTDPATDAPGFTLEFRDVHGSVLATEHRLGAQAVVWPGLYPEGTRIVVLRTRIIPAVDGEHVLEVLGLGAMTATVDGEAHILDLGTGTGDFGEFLMRPPLTHIPVAARAGAPVDVELVHTADSDLLVVSMGLGWAPVRPDEEAEMAAAVADAAAADVAVVVVGTTEDIESEGFDRTGLALPGRSDELVARVAAANRNTVVVVNAGSPVLMPWRDDVAAVLWAWLPGQEGGAAVADILTGAAEPGGRLPTSFPADETDVPVLASNPVDGVHAYTEGSTIGYRLWALRGAKPGYPFGYGLGYTDWEYRDLTVEGNAADGLTVRVDVANTGARTGREIVQAYLEPLDGELFGSAEPLRLVGFAAVDAEPGATRTVSVDVPSRDLARWDAAAGSWRTVPGTYRLTVGRNAEDAGLTTTITL